MSTQEKDGLKKSAYAEALRYMDNAKENLHKANKQGKFYGDAKYVRTASGIAYNAVLLALDTLLKTKDIHANAKNRKSIDWYRDQLRKIDLKLLNEVNTAYEVLNLSGYYDGLTNVNVINEGLDSALSIIKRIKPSVN